MTDAPQSRLASYPPGYDEADPYAGEDLSQYPDWWRRNIERFREHGMRPYRPPRFSDDELVPEHAARLEEELGVPVRIRSLHPHTESDWKVWVDEEPVHPVEHDREAEGFTRYDIDSERFEEIVRGAVGGGADAGADAE